MNRRTTQRRRPATTTRSATTNKAGTAGKAGSTGTVDESAEVEDEVTDATEASSIDVDEDGAVEDEAEAEDQVETDDESAEAEASDTVDGAEVETADDDVDHEVEATDDQEPVDEVEVVDDEVTVEEPDVAADEEWAIDAESRRALEEAGYPDLDEADDAAPELQTRRSASAPAARYGPLESVIKRPLIMVVSVGVCVVVALALALAKPVVYTAENQLIVGGVVRDYVPAAGQTDAILELTDIYSRLAGSAAHMERVNAALGSTVPFGSISAAPVPNSALVRLEATAPTSQEAIERANAGGEQLVAEVNALKDAAEADDEALFARVQEANLEVATAEEREQAAQDALDAATTPTQAQRDAYTSAASAAATARVKRDVLASNYQASTAAKADGIDLAVFNATDVASSNRNKTILLYGFVGLVVGALIGMAVSTLVANRWKLLPDEGPTTTGV